MLFFSLLKRRFNRALICLRRALPKALAVQSVMMLILAAFSCFFLSGSINSAELLAYMIFFIILLWLIFFFEQIARYGTKIFHLYDEDIIKNAFTDLSRKSAIFEEALGLLHEGSAKEALLMFTELDDDKYKKTDEERGVLSFYRGHCYQLLGMYPNAVIQYEKAKEQGFYVVTLPLQTARCYARNGDTAAALRLYEEILDTDYEYSYIVRTDIGHMYLELNDGENAYKWFREAAEKHQDFATALGGTAVALLLLGREDESRRFYNAAILNSIPDAEDFKKYYKEVREAALSKTDEKS